MNKDRKIDADYLIIGNSAGGIGAAEAIREVDRNGSIVMISDEPYQAYSRPLISEYLAGECKIDQMLFRSSDFYEKNNVYLVLDKKATSLNLQNRTIKLEDNAEIGFRKILLATGGVPIVPKIIGKQKKGVFTFLTLGNAKGIVDFLEMVNSAVVIGGGLIGISATEALVKRGIMVTLVEMKDKVLNTILDEEASCIAEDALKRKGVRIVTNHTVKEVQGNSTVESVILDDGNVIKCELVIIAIGVLPRTDLVEGTRIEVNRGILVDRHMRTNNADVYACGDTAEAYDFLYRTNRVIPIWPNAYIGGKVAGYNMAGLEANYPGSTAMNSLNYFGLDIATAGMVQEPDSGDSEVIVSKRNGYYQKLVLCNNVIVGMVFIGRIENAGIIYGLIREGFDVGSFKQSLLADDFGLVYLPDKLRRERLSGITDQVIPKMKPGLTEYK